MPMPYSDLVEAGTTWDIEHDKLAVAFVTIIKREEANEQLRMIANFGAPILIDVEQGRAIQHIMPLGRYSYHQQVWPC